MLTTNNNKNYERLHSVYFKISLAIFGQLTVAFPVIAIVGCFISAMIFQFDEVNLTMCKVQNVIPSMSAIAGVTPQRYFWRFLMGLQVSPRLIIGLVYLNYYYSRTQCVARQSQKLFNKLLWTDFIFYTIENLCLFAVSVVGNTENYPLHEKIFVIFMFTSLVHELTSLICYKLCHPSFTDIEEYSYKLKKIWFAGSLTFTAGLLYFFWRHRFFCEAHAFTFFSLFEYCIAFANIAYHYTARLDFQGTYWYLALPYTSNTSNGHVDTLVNGTSEVNDTNKRD